jgi:hypothetical protein
MRLPAKMANTLVIAACLVATVLCFAMSSFLGAAVVVVELGSLIAPTNVAGANTFADSVLQEARGIITKDKQNFNLRPIMTNILPMFTNKREFTVPDLAKIKESDIQETSALYLKKGAFTINTDKTCTPAGETTGSAKVDVEWQKLGFAVRSANKPFRNNVFKKATVLAHDLYRAELAFWEELDQVLLDYLEANKSSVNLGTRYGGFDVANGIYGIDKQYETRFYNIVQAHMKKNNYRPMYQQVNDTMFDAVRQFFGNQGPTNGTNTAFQFDGFTWQNSNLIEPGTIGANTYESISYIVPEGGVAILDWNDKQNMEGDSTGSSEWGRYQSLVHPEFTFDLFKTEECADTTSSGGGKQDKVENFEMTLNFALVKPPIEVVGETPIFKYGIADDNTFTT